MEHGRQHGEGMVAGSESGSALDRVEPGVIIFCVWRNQSWLPAFPEDLLLDAQPPAHGSRCELPSAPTRKEGGRKDGCGAFLDNVLVSVIRAQTRGFRKRGPAKA